jgi:anaerobic ribonucleoside-triphosphate reductase activating protein
VSLNAAGSILANLHAVEPRSLANGPGRRFAVWFQGCTLRCPGCYNPATHSTEANGVATIEELLSRVEDEGRKIDGVSITGGEPFEQPLALLTLARGLRERFSLSLLVFSGYTLEEIRCRPLGRETLACIDVLIDGRYSESKRLGRSLRGSSNKRIHLLSDRHTLDEVEAAPEAEIMVDPQGRIAISGIDPSGLSPLLPDAG